MNSSNVNEQSNSPRDFRNPDNTSGMSVSQNSAMSPIVVKPVDRKTIEGSTPGDFRAKAAPVTMPAQGAVRQQMAGQQNSRSYREDGSAFQSNDSDSDSKTGV